MKRCYLEQYVNLSSRGAMESGDHAKKRGESEKPDE
jgi:hypothetical protein